MVIKMSNKIFSDLQSLGFDNLNDINIYKKDNNTSIVEDKKKEVNKLSHIYEKEVSCPVCNNVFKAKAVKTSSYRLASKDSDLFMRFSLINPYFYDVWICDNCGYASLKNDFGRLSDLQVNAVITKVKSKWKGREYPEEYNEDIAIERYKLALLNYIVIGAKSSKKAMTCLKIAWMYRLKTDTENENIFLSESLKGFEDAYLNEDLPIYGMDKFTLIYLIGELNRRLAQDDKALKWFGDVITSKGSSVKLKDLARGQRDLIKEKQAIEELKTTELPPSVDLSNDESKSKNIGFLSKLFKKS